MKELILMAGIFLFISCGGNSEHNEEKENQDSVIVEQTYPDVQVAGQMKDVMWEGKLAGIIHLDTMSNKKGLYGLGPQSYLTGELLINDGRSYVSHVLTDSTMEVIETFDLDAPFFVYGNVVEWKKVQLDNDINNIQMLEYFIDEKTIESKRPFVFKLVGTLDTAIIHIQDLPEGTEVHSPDEAHQGQVNYTLYDEEVEIIGFFSTEHKGIFTHHDSFMHMHLITADKSKMGHLDKIDFDPIKMALYLPIQ